jgi:hypothetical protein
MSAPPITFRWSGEAMEPVGRFSRECDRVYTVGEKYTLVEHQDRSQRTHNHYFASLSEAWANLPEDQAERFPTVDHLRKFALIKRGFADQADFVASSKAEAIRLAAFLRSFDEYAVVTIRDNVVTRWTAKSQNRRSMGAKAFAESKNAVLDYCASLIGVAPEALSRNAREAA